MKQSHVLCLPALLSLVLGDSIIPFEVGMPWYSSLLALQVLDMDTWSTTWSGVDTILTLYLVAQRALEVALFPW